MIPLQILRTLDCHCEGSSRLGVTRNPAPSLGCFLYDNRICRKSEQELCPA